MQEFPTQLEALQQITSLLRRHKAGRVYASCEMLGSEKARSSLDARCTECVWLILADVMISRYKTPDVWR